MISGEHHHSRDVFSAERAGHLDTPLRRILYHPERIAGKYVKPGDRVLDFGCGPGFFTREFAKKAGDGGLVIAADLQEEMLAIVRQKMGAEGLLSRIKTHRCLPDTLNLSAEKESPVNVAFAIFVVHEVPDREKLFREIAAMLVPGGIFFYSEPPFLVSGKEFRDNLALLKRDGFRVIESRWFFVNRAAVLRKEK